MTQRRFGASPEAWDHFADKLGLTEDLLPVVSNPNAEISPLSKIKALGKTPSMYNRDRKVVGLTKWTNIAATEFNVQVWKSEPDYGICVQTRKVRAFDIDVADPIKSSTIARTIHQTLGRNLPMRYREDSGKLLLAFTYNRPLTKHVLTVDGGIIEILATGQQFIAAGTHPEGAEYAWEDDLPAAFPVLTGEELDRVKATLEAIFDTGDGWRIARERRKGAGSDLKVHDDVADWLMENWEIYDVGSADQLFIECPFAEEHSSDTGPSSTAYFPAGTGGYAQGHFVCLHAHCVGRSDADYRDATGYSVAQFADLTVPGADGGPVAERAAAQRLPDSGGGTASGLRDRVGQDTDEPAPLSTTKPDWPNMVRTKDGKIEPTADNMRKAIAHGSMVLRRVAYDSFTDNLTHRKLDEFDNILTDWESFTDADMVDVRVELERRGFKPMGKELLREVTHAAGFLNKRDSAKDWLAGIAWDGQSRVERFAMDCWGWKDCDYSRAVSRYVWTALAGRIVQPGVRADMAPILVGIQGIKKTSAIQAMVPNEDLYAEIKLNDRDDDLSRKLRGKLVGELEELRGLQSRAIEEIKAFVSRRRESWVPKFKEFENFFWRRCLLFGTTNDTQFLADPTGERRWLPGECGIVDIERIVEDREQLWAEGAVLFGMEGVEWEAAERLAEREHPRFKIGDTWENVLANWIEQEDVAGKTPLDVNGGHVTVHEALTALGIPASHATRGHELRAMKALRHIGLKEVDVVNGDRSFKGYER